jgi:hypothetical protein
VSVIYKGAPLHLLIERATLDEPFKVNGESFGQVCVCVCVCVCLCVCVCDFMGVHCERACGALASK